jgi:uncharacterized protein YyaL (SSP411 family)
MPNRLAGETSPYLLQHAENPVDWRPWGPEALAAARAENRPIFLSIGYSACHWCHVMEHESFEDPKVAALLNREFIAIKVDREERPELDQIYMEAVQALTGHGGWPLSVFLTPDLEPFFGGTYWPPSPRGGMPGFLQVLTAVADAWRNRYHEAVEQAKKLTAVLRESAQLDLKGGSDRLGDHLLEGAYAALTRAFDRQNGGFGAAPKSPHATELRLLLRRWRRTGNAPILEMVSLALDNMAAGGIFDHLGGGFHRYSTDAHWLVPHFEKMLYDNALIPSAYLEAYQATGRQDYVAVVRETLDYVLRDMTGPEGGFYSSEDADSEGEEGRFYLWDLEEIRSLLGPDRADVFTCVYDVSKGGNFEGRNLLNRAKTFEECAAAYNRPLDQLHAELAEARCKLFGARARRVPPGKDDKVLVSWNGLLIDVLAQAGAVLGEPRYLDAAARAADFLLAHLRSERGDLLHSWRQGRPGTEALLDDHASLGNALVTLYETRFEERWIDEAVRLAEQTLSRFADREEGGFYTAPADHPSLLVRMKDMADSSLPSGGALAVMLLLRLSKLCGRDDFREAAEMGLRAAAPLMERYPFGMGQMLLALDAYLGPTPEVVILGSPDRAATDEVLEAVHRRYLPSKVVAFRPTGDGNRSSALAGLFENKHPLPPGPTIYVCENFACLPPVTGKDAALATLDSLAEAAAPTA